MWLGNMIVVVRFQSSSKSRHVSPYVRGIQATNEVDVPAGPAWPKRKPRVLSKLTFVSSYPLVRVPSLRNGDPPQRLSLLRWLQLNDTIFTIHRFRYVVRSSRCSKRYDAPTSMRAVMDSDGYLCVMIPTIKRCGLGSYEEIIMCKSCNYGDPEFSRPQLQLQQIYIHLDLNWEKNSFLITTGNITHNYSLLSSSKDTILTSEGFRPAPHWCSWPERYSSLFSIFDKINWECSAVCGGNFTPHWCFRWDFLSLRSEFPPLRQTLP